MGRYPLKTAIGEYMDANKAYYSPSTLASAGSILRTIEREYAGMRAKNPNLKAEPVRWGEPEITALMFGIRRMDLSHNSQVQYIVILKGLLRFVGNGIMERMKARHPTMFPRIETERKPSMTDGQLSEVLDSVGKIRGWRGECIRFLTWTYAYTGLRLSELARAERSDLNTTSWTLRVSHPKGERTYGKQRIVPIPEPLRPVVVQYLRAREGMLARKGMLETHPLVFTERHLDRSVSAQMVAKWKCVLEKVSGVGFTVHSLRRTYGQTLLDRGVPLETVSVMLGHSSTITTERHYCRKDTNSAMLEVNRAFERSTTSPSVNPPLIDRKNLLPGYA
jgi:integrase